MYKQLHKSTSNINTGKSAGSFLLNHYWNPMFLSHTDDQTSSDKVGKVEKQIEGKKVSDFKTLERYFYHLLALNVSLCFRGCKNARKKFFLTCVNKG